MSTQLGQVFNVMEYGSVGDGVADDSATDQAAAIAAGAVNGAVLLFPPDHIFHHASQVTVTSPGLHTLTVIGHGAEITTAGAISGLKLTGGSTLGGVSVHGLKINHRNNTLCTFGFELEQTWHARLIDCKVVANEDVAGYAAVSLANGTSSDPTTGCFWTEINQLQVRKQSGGDNGNITVGVLLKGAANATTIRGGSLGNCVTPVLHTFHAGETYLANGLLVDGVAIEGYTTAYHQLSNGGYVAVRLVNNRFELGTTVFSFTGGGASSQHPFFAGNVFISNAGAYINNPDDLPYIAYDASITPDYVADTPHFSSPVFIQSLQGADMPLIVKTAGGGRGIQLENGSGVRVALLSWTGTGNEAALIGDPTDGLEFQNIRSISATATPGDNLRGSATFATSGTVSVSFGTDEPDATYFLAISGDVDENFWVTSKAVGGFTINSDNALSTATVDWVLIR